MLNPQSTPEQSFTINYIDTSYKTIEVMTCSAMNIMLKPSLLTLVNKAMTARFLHCSHELATSMATRGSQRGNLVEVAVDSFNINNYTLMNTFIQSTNDLLVNSMLDDQLIITPDFRIAPQMIKAIRSMLQTTEIFNSDQVSQLNMLFDALVEMCMSYVYAAKEEETPFGYAA